MEALAYGGILSWAIAALLWLVGVPYVERRYAHMEIGVLLPMIVVAVTAHALTAAGAVMFVAVAVLALL